MLASLRRQHPAMQRRALRRLYREAVGSGRDLSFIHVEELRQLAISERPTGKVLALSGGYRVCFSYDRLFLRQSSEEVSETPADLAVRPEIPGVTEAGGLVIEAEFCRERPAPAGPGAFYLDADVLARGPLVFRHRRPGDFIELPAGRKKLKDVLIDDKVPREERSRLLLLANGQEILWIAGRRRTRHYPVTDRTKRILYFQIKEKRHTND